MKITDDYEKFVKQFYSKIYEILDRAFCIFPTFLCRVDLVSNLQTPSCPLGVWNKDYRSLEDSHVGYTAVLKPVIYHPQEKEIGLL